MPNILCYGDSNTWGANPEDLTRYAKEERWTGILQELMGTSNSIIEEGLPGRTTVWSDPIEGYKSGKEYLIPCLETHAPLDLVIIMLGTNDLKKRFSVTAFDIASGVITLVQMAQANFAQSSLYRGRKAPQILVVTPPPVKEIGFLAEMFEGGEEKSKRFAEAYKRVGDWTGTEVMDASLHISASDVDGIHFDRGAQRVLADAIAGKIRLMLK
jgi:lysophospholipase L1-like esterase